MALAVIISIVLKKFGDILNEEPTLFNGVRDQVVSIKEELQVLQRHFRDNQRAEGEGLQRSRWAAEARDVVFETENVLDTFIYWREQRRKQNILMRYTFIHFRTNFFKKLKRIHTKIRESSEVRLSFGINPIEYRHETYSIEYRHETYSMVERPHHETHFFFEKAPIGLEDDVELLVPRLIDEKEDVQKDRRRVISIVGMGGLGKTTLAKLLYNDSRVIEYFQIRCWIYVSQDYRVEEILNGILNSIMGHRESSLTVEQLKKQLYDLLMGKRYLFVMDDVWDAESWVKIEALLPDTGNGNRVLLTTRNRDVASRVDPRSHPHEMKFLDAEHSWMLLQRSAGGDKKPFSPKRVEVGKKLANRCGGLPLAIQMVGSLMYLKTLTEWSTLLDRFHVALGKTDYDYSYSGILELSYNELPSHLMPLYLYLLFFPKEHEIPFRRIFGLWLAEGFLTWKHEEVSREELAQDYLQELIARNMIQVVKWKLDGTPKTCRFHGFLRDMLLPRAHEMGLFQNQNINSGTSPATPTSAVRHLVEYTDINNYSSLESFIENSRSYISFNFRKGDIPAEQTGKFLARVIQKRSFGLLGVLDLERVYKPKLPESLGKLHLLKYLGLRWTFLDAIPSSVGDLLNLETLDVKHTYISRLPSSIRKMKKLQHLYLNEIHLDLSVGDIALQNLRTLWGLTADGEFPLPFLITLTKLGLTVQDTFAEVYAEWILRLTDLRILRFRSQDEYGQPSDLMLGSFSHLSYLHDLYLLGKLTMENPLHALQLPESLTVLTLSVSGLEQDPMPTLELLPKLRALRLFARSYTGKSMVCSNGGFRSLCILELWMLEELEEWIIEDGAMRFLTLLEIRCCKKLKKCPKNMLQLHWLKDLILTNMSKDFVAEVKAGKGETVSLTLNNWEFPTFPDQESSHGGEGSG